ncbi:MAG: carbohydrate porin [Leptolyngbyaceae cyanobacterium T60_A2020_046]|nr:carbohydrate porin [Leptolyngbyaceae cyanobacterium T60_A2020_046]
MSNKLWKAILASPALLGMAVAGSAIAAEAPSVETLDSASAGSVELAQITSVDELTDVLPSDWAYTALQNLVNTYGCIEGYPNRTFRGNQPLTRYEFAAGLNACLDVIAQIIGVGGVNESDLATIQRLQQEFQAELATLRGRVDALEAETAELRAQQFSTTTKLRGQVDANLVVPFDDINGGDDNTVFTTRSRMNFDTSFTGEDRLRVRLQAGEDNFGILPAGGGLANSTGGSSAQTFDVRLDDFYYSFPIGSRLDVILAANNVVTDDFVVSTIVPFDGPSVADPGAPLLYDFDMGGGGFGAGFSFALTDSLVFDAGYSARESNDSTVFASNNPNAGGIFGAQSQSYIAQLSFLPEGFFSGALTYMHGDGGDGAYTDTYGGLVNFDFGALMLGGYFAFHEEDSGADDTSFQVGVAFPDLFLEGSQLGIYYADIPTYGGNNPYMVEGYYSIPVNQFVTITPALIYGDLDEGDGTENFYGAIRATFKF